MNLGLKVVWRSLSLISVLSLYTVLLGSAHAEHAVLEEEGVVKLVATLENNPAFTDVVWRVYRLDSREEQVIIVPRHTGTVNLRPGSYKAVALLKSKNKERSRYFQLKSNSREEVVLSLD